MKVPSLLLAAGALLASGAAAVDPTQQEFIIGGDYLTYSRLDPIVAPGRLSDHLHGIIGASNFGSTLRSPQDMQSAACTSARITADKSNYWHPTVFFINANGTYSPLIATNRIYYKIFNNGGKTKVNAFPPGLRMISGNAMKRQPGSIQSYGVFIKMSEAEERTQYILNGTDHPNAPQQVTLGVVFPSCGKADQSLDSDDHFSHMTWPVHTGDQDGPVWSTASSNCPDTHPIMYPQINVEVRFNMEKWQTEQWNKQGPNFILSNGDTTGLTFHADFVNGWDQDVLQRAIDQCWMVGDQLQNCPVFNGMVQGGQSPANGHDCRIQTPIPDEDIGAFQALERLPGCNERWDWDGPVDKPPCSGGSNPAMIIPKAQYAGPTFLSIPLSVPANTANVTDLKPAFGWYQDPPSVVPWATKWGRSGGAIDLTPAPQAATFSAMNPPTAINLAEATKGSVDFHANRTLQCQGHPLLPCQGPTVSTDVAGSVGTRKRSRSRRRSTSQ